MTKESAIPNKKRLEYIDNLKGILIIMVVLGHSIQNFTPDYSNDFMFRFIYSFHMPLFFFVSGFVSYKEKLTWESVWKRFKQLMIPFVIWAIVKSIILWDITKLPFILTHPDNGLWFLYTLFFISVIMRLCDTLAEKIKLRRDIIIVAIACVLLGLMAVAGLRGYGFDLVAWYFIFYAAGFLAKQAGLFEHVSLIMSIIATVLFLALVPLWRVNGYPVFMTEGWNPLFNSLWRLVVPTIAILGLFSLSMFTLKKKSILLNYLGQRTLGIYAIHPALINLYIVLYPNFKLGGAFLSLLIATGLLFISSIIYEILIKNRTIAFLFLGK